MRPNKRASDRGQNCKGNRPRKICRNDIEIVTPGNQTAADPTVVDLTATDPTAVDLTATNHTAANQ